MPPNNPLNSHYKELFSRPENNSDVFYTKGHKVIQMQESQKQPKLKESMGNRRLAHKLMESEAFGSPRESPSPEKSPDQSELNKKITKGFEQHKSIYKNKMQIQPETMRKDSKEKDNFIQGKDNN